MELNIEGKLYKILHHTRLPHTLRIQEKKNTIRTLSLYCVSWLALHLSLGDRSQAFKRHCE
ncbi:CLUMA_CG012337, isoform A [Clunio marinus]|uniref:CLUMA_CG012337, isoform A n=1 Tax=Clunio marinus TaxID=568069 RepID=A0A1J1IGP7_9DIPT|nr:CLUMA_CG012337, isoform A [Clunio marinus]